jgi:hypothetical protein
VPIRKPRSGAAATETPRKRRHGIEAATRDENGRTILLASVGVSAGLWASSDYSTVTPCLAFGYVSSTNELSGYRCRARNDDLDCSLNAESFRKIAIQRRVTIDCFVAARLSESYLARPMPVTTRLSVCVIGVESSRPVGRACVG